MQDIPLEIISKAAQGDIKSFEQIYRAGSGFVYASALRLLGNSSDAEEVTQDVFLKIYENLSRFRFRSSLKTWIYRITVNTAFNLLRKRKKYDGSDFELAVKTGYSENTTQKALDRNENKELVSVLLAQLNPEQRVCLMLREIEGLSYKEIAAVLKININTVRSRLKRARQALLGLRQKKVIENEM